MFHSTRHDHRTTLIWACHPGQEGKDHFVKMRYSTLQSLTTKRVSYIFKRGYSGVVEPPVHGGQVVDLLLYLVDTGPEKSSENKARGMGRFLTARSLSLSLSSQTRLSHNSTEQATSLRATAYSWKGDSLVASPTAFA